MMLETMWRWAKGREGKKREERSEMRRRGVLTLRFFLFTELRELRELRELQNFRTSELQNFRTSELRTQNSELRSSELRTQRLRLAPPPLRIRVEARKIGYGEEEAT
jgi:hypothetical protein